MTRQVEERLGRYGPWAVVTGASEGIGRAVARDLAGAGFNLVLVARRQHLLERLAADIRRHGVDVVVVATDLGTTEGVESVLEATRSIDVGLLVACAGFGTSGYLVDSDLETEVDMVQVNVVAVLRLVHRFAGRLKAMGRGAIVLFGSVVASQGVPRAANYAATKAYVQSLGEALSIELEPHGVEVMLVVPGPVNSGFGQRADMEMGRALNPETVAAEFVAALGRRRVVRPGLQSKMLGYALTVTPRRIRTRIMTRVMSRFTAHQVVKT